MIARFAQLHAANSPHARGRFGLPLSADQPSTFMGPSQRSLNAGSEAAWGDQPDQKLGA
jgi:hypothetical protein